MTNLFVRIFRCIVLLIYCGFSFIQLDAQTISMVTGTLKSACPAVPCGDGGLAIDAKLYSPTGLAIDASDNIYIAEYSNHAIRKIDKTTGIITTVAGIQRSACTTAPCGNGGAATSAQLNGPRGVGFDADGNMYIADFSNHAIRKVDKNTGIISTVAGTIRSSCSTLPCGDGGLATAAQLNSPTAMKFDATGNMYIADYGNHVIRKVDKVTGVITTVAGTMKTSCSAAPCGDGSLATSALFNGPSNIAFDPDGNLFVAEYGNHAIRKIDKTTGIITTYAGTQRASCSVAPCGDGGPATDVNARLTSPFSLNFDALGNLYIADASNAAIRRVDKNTGIITTVAGIVKSSCAAAPCGNDGPATAAQLSNPFGVAFNSTGNMYILEYSNQALRMVSGSTLPLTFGSFNAQTTENAVHLTWRALGETNVKAYQVERSDRGISFLPEGIVAARGNGGADISYNWIDSDPFAGNNYYRIKSVDNDGSTSFSPVLRVSLMDKGPKMEISPNPVTNKVLYLQWQNMTAGKYELQLYNNTGQLIFSRSLVTSGGNSNQGITLPASLSPGPYSVHMKNDRTVLNIEKIIVQ